MKRIIFSIYTNTVDKVGYSVTDYKLDQFEKYKDKLVERKQIYADKCSADFVLVETVKSDFVDIQFEKIRLLEEYAKTYDEVLYLDFDVIPSKLARNIFECIDSSKISMHPLDRPLNGTDMRTFLRNACFDSQNMFVKTAAKKSMLVLEGLLPNDFVYNTGVILGNSSAIVELKFTERLDEMNDLMEDIKDDHMFPSQIGDHFVPNNEVYISYLIERYNIPHNDLTMNWNYIMDDIETIPDAKADFIHCVSKDFKLVV
jgi:hypothetical protein